jgi:hypothetical protein
MRKRWRWKSDQPKAIWITPWRLARVLSARNRNRRQIIGLMWRIQTWNW